MAISNIRNAQRGNMNSYFRISQFSIFLLKFMINIEGGWGTLKGQNQVTKKIEVKMLLTYYQYIKSLLNHNKSNIRIEIWFHYQVSYHNYSYTWAIRNKFLFKNEGGPCRCLYKACIKLSYYCFEDSIWQKGLCGWIRTHFDKEWRDYFFFLKKLIIE